MHLQIILKEFGPNNKHISGAGNIVINAISRLLSTSVKNYEPITMKAQCCANDLFSNGGIENNNDSFPLYILNVQIEQQKDPRNKN